MLTIAVATFPSLVAEIVAVPVETAVTSPSEDTVASAALLVPQLTARPDNALPDPSRTSAVSCAVCPTTRSLDSGDSTTLATGTADTVIDATALLPSLLAVMIAPPTASAVTCPLSVTVAIAGSLVVQTIGRLLRTCPSLSSACALSCTTSPTNIDRCDDESRTIVTGVGFTVTRANASLPQLLAAIRTVPTLRPVTTPAALTSAIAGSSLAHDTRCCGTIDPSTLRTSAVRESVAPTDTVAVDGATWTDSIDWPGPNVSDVQANTTVTRIVAVKRDALASADVKIERKVNRPLGLS